MGPIGAQEMALIVLIALLLFGPKKLPELGRLLGKGLTEFRRAKNELKTTFDTHMQELDREARLSEQSEKAKANPTAATDYSSPTYSYPYDEQGRYGSSYQSAPDYSATSSASPEAPISATPSDTVPRSKTPLAVEPLTPTTEESHPA